jgi:predicted RNA-binding Zn ribbon-like protein
MKLLDERLLRRCKICPDCEWLFLDQSKNQSRMWCDMAVCGNRAKARAHYARTVKAPHIAVRART